jgi:ribosome recycling factor
VINDVRKDAEQRMTKAVASLSQGFRKLRTGRAHPSLLDHLRVDYYGNDVPLQQCSNVTVEDARTLSVTPWEPKMVGIIEKAIMGSDLGLTPVTAGTVIRIPLPPLTEERRRALAKVIGHEAEQGRVAVRNVRRDVMNELKEMLREKMITEDEERRAHQMIQELTDRFVAQVDQAADEKTKEIMSV